MNLFDDIEEEPKEGSEDIDPVVACWERDVKDFYRRLYKEEEAFVVGRLEELRAEFKAKMLEIPEVREKLAKVVTKKGSLAMLAEDYNAKIKGNAETITARIRAAVASGMLEAANFKIEVFEELYEGQFDKTWQEIRALETRLIQAGIKISTRLGIKAGNSMYGIDAKDLVQVANEKLLEAVKRYRLGYKTRFVTYAYWYIDTQLKKYIMNNSREVRIPEEKVDLMLSVLKAHSALPEGYNADQLVKKVNEVKQKKYSGFSSTQIEQAIAHLGSNPLPLDTSLGQDSENRTRTIGELLQSNDASPEDIVEAKALLEKGEDALLNTLDEVEAAIIYFRYLDPDYSTRRNYPERPYAEIPDIIEAHRLPYKILRESVRKIEKKAFMKLRLDNEWFWNRLKDEVLSTFLNENELMVLFVQTIRPTLSGNKRKTWAEVEKMTGIPAKEVVKLSRTARIKLRRNFPEIDQWVTINSRL